MSLCLCVAYFRHNLLMCLHVFVCPHMVLVPCNSSRVTPWGLHVRSEQFYSKVQMVCSAQYTGLNGFRFDIFSVTANGIFWVLARGTLRNWRHSARIQQNAKIDNWKSTPSFLNANCLQLLVHYVLSGNTGLDYLIRYRGNFIDEIHCISGRKNNVSACTLFKVEIFLYLSLWDSKRWTKNSIIKMLNHDLHARVTTWGYHSIYS